MMLMINLMMNMNVNMNYDGEHDNFHSDECHALLWKCQEVINMKQAITVTNMDGDTSEDEDDDNVCNG